MPEIVTDLPYEISNTAFLVKDNREKTAKNNLDFLDSATIYFDIMFGYLKIVEKKIRDALKEGEFENLPGKGKPRNLDDDSRIPEDLRMAHKVLKNANCLLEELELRKDIRNMEEMLKNIPDEKSSHWI